MLDTNKNNIMQGGLVWKSFCRFNVLKNTFKTFEINIDRYIVASFSHDFTNIIPTNGGQKTNPVYSLEYGYEKNTHTRLRLGLSSWNEHLFKYNLYLNDNTIYTRQDNTHTHSHTHAR
jgi:hypothetical protein